MNNKTTLVLIRHGLTAANVNKLYCGSTDLDLTDDGILGIKNLAEQNIYPHTQLYFTSGMLRTNQTIALIHPNVQFTQIPGFREFDFGDFENNSYDQLKELPTYIEWIQDEIGDYPCPNGESKNEYTTRISNALTLLLKEISGQTATLVCHGGVIATIMSIFFPDENNFYEWQPPNGGGYIVVFDDNGAIYKKL